MLDLHLQRVNIVAQPLSGPRPCPTIMNLYLHIFAPYAITEMHSNLPVLRTQSSHLNPAY